MFRRAECGLMILGIWLAASSGSASQEYGPAKTPQTDTNPLVYRIGPGDVLQIDIWKEPDVSIPSVTVRPDGRISMAMVGDVSVVGLTPAELEAGLRERFGSLIKEPRITVSVRDANSQKIYIIGEVRREGPIRMTGPITVLQALAEAGGVTEYAKRKDIYVLRLVNGRQMHFAFNYESVLKGQKPEQNIRLQPGDTVVVPR
jgi:polysaccharide export outer membrane protein